jgi:phosphoglucomutase
MEVSPLAGKPADPSILINVSNLVAAYLTGQPDHSVPAQRVAFGTSGHRDCSLDNSFNEAHILAITQAICLYRKQQSIDGPLYIGFDTHALSGPAFRTALEVLAGNRVDVMVDAADSYTPTPVISHAILTYLKLTEKFGNAYYQRVDASATTEQKERLENLSPEEVTTSALADEPITAKLNKAPGNHAPVGGVKVITTDGWFAARPSGTESIYKIYAESFKDRAHLDAILHEAQAIVNNALEVRS